MDDVKSKPRIVLVSAELKTFKVRAGGLGPMVEELAYALAKIGCETSVISPFYRFARNEKDEIVEVDYNDINFEDAYKLSFWVGGERVEAGVKKIEKNGVKFYFLDNERIVGLLYEGDNLKKAIFLARGTLELVKILKNVDVIHLNDGHTGLIPVFFKAEPRFNEDPSIKNLKFVFTIHNAGRAYQQLFSADRFNELGIGGEWEEKVIWRGEINLTYAAMFSEISNTVSLDYAETIKNDEGLEEVFKSKGVFGITNGIDVAYWKMPGLKDVKSVESLKKIKAEAKVKLFDEIEKRTGAKFSNKKLTIITPRRFAEQKGLEIILKNMDKICKKRKDGGIEAQMIMQGRAALGDPLGRRWEEICKEFNHTLKDEFVFFHGFNEELAKKMYWGGDVLLFPSLPGKEPCGTGYMMASVNGTVTLGTDTGGMVEKIIDSKNGFDVRKEDYSWDAFFEKLKIISQLFYKNKKEWDKIVWNSFKTDVDVVNVAREYLKKSYFPVLKRKD